MKHLQNQTITEILGYDYKPFIELSKELKYSIYFTYNMFTHDDKRVN